MIILAFETATPAGGAALMRDGNLLGERIVNNPQAHSRQCLCFAEELLQSNNLKWDDIDGLATSHGPGSFTGVRVGITLVKGLAWSLKRPCVTVSTLEAMALVAQPAVVDEPFIVPLIDARVGEVYGAVFRPNESGLERLTEDFSATPDCVARRLAGRALFTGEGARRYFDPHLAPLGCLAPPDFIPARPGAVATLANEHFRKGHIRNPAEITPLYLRQATTTRPPSA